ncbi:MAG: hypothetical protein GXP29_08870 [Planctomycetes bacterium]|nr:hypothetical protein [Planctomycetota bacterium]
MAKGSLRRYDVQAKYAFLISLCAVGGVAALTVLIFRNFKQDEMSVVYSRNGLFGPIVVITTALTCLLAATGAAIGLNSAGQKRNELNRRSWMAFFIGTGALSVTLILFVAFLQYGMKL